MWLVEVWKLTAFGEAIFINATDTTTQKMAGNGVHDQLALFTFFDVLFFDFGNT